MSGTLTCQQFGTFLSRRSEHLDDDILKDWFPTDDAWVGHVSTGNFDAYAGGGAGFTHTYDRFHVAFPDLTGKRGAVNSASCTGTPCDPNEKKVGYGTTRTEYGLLTESWTTDLVCWDQVLLIDRAKEQYGEYVRNLKKVSAIINSNWFKTEALRGAGTLYLSGAAEATAAITLTETDGQPMVLDTGGVYPTSLLTMPYLQRFVEALQLEGYFQERIAKQPVFKFITDDLTSYSLREGNSVLANLFRFEDFDTGGNLYKIGATSGVGNFVFGIDSMPLRFNKRASDGKLCRVYPYTNASATTGIKRVRDAEYDKAEFQISFIWHPMAMRILTLQGQALNASMPFMVRDFAGKWQFAMDNIVVDGCPVDNKRRNKGLWFADFRTATRYERPELVRAILHQRRGICVTDVVPCAPGVAFTTQNTDSNNAACAAPGTLVFTPVLGADGGYTIAPNTVQMNGVPIVHAQVGSAGTTTIAALVTSLGSVLPSGLGTWSDTTPTLTLTGCNCVSVYLPFVE